MTNNDFVSFRCGKPTKAGTACRTPVAHSGAACGSHRPATKTSEHFVEQDHVTAFIENFRCIGCDADVQLVVVAHDSGCPQLAEHVSRRHAA